MHPSTSAKLPTGTVTFLFTDIEGSTQRWDAKREAMQDAVRRHDEVLRDAIESHGGVVFKTVGDAFCAAFSRPEDATTAALEAQRALRAADFATVDGLHVRVALHTGTTDERNGDYFGPTVNKVARLLAVGHGGQILLSGITADLVRDKLPAQSGLRDLGRHRLKDLAEATTIAQLTAPELPQEFPELRSLDAQPNNLPQQLTAFIGREAELREAGALFANTRLLTLAGPGGVGKTRMAVQLAADSSDEFPDGVWFVDLAPLTDGIFISPTMLSTMGVREEPDRDTTETLATYLRDKSALIVLDNCEHVVADAARVAERLLRDCSKVKIIATTREALGIAAETVFRVLTFGESDGVQLFLTRARAVAPSFELTPQNAELVAQICRRLDGIALAIELAAARVKMMNVEELWKRLDDRFRILTGGSRTALARQQTLRGLIEWSYNLLDEPEKVFLRRLAIFSGGFSLDSATAICAYDPVDEFDALDIVTRLIDKSLVQFEPAESRYYLLSSTKAYALEWLANSGEWDALQRRRFSHFHSLAENAEVALNTGSADVERDQLTRDYGDYRSIMQWALVDGNDVRAGAAAAVSLGRYWQERGLFREGRFWLQRVLQHGTDEIGSETEAYAHLGLTAMAFVAGEIELMEKHALEALRIFTEIDDSFGAARARNAAAITADLFGRHEHAYDLYQENLAISRSTGNQRIETTSLLNTAELLARWKEDFAEAKPLLEGAVRISREIHDTYSLAAALESSAIVASFAQEYDRAEAFAREALEVFRKVGDEQHVVDMRVSIIWTRALSGKPADSTESFEEVVRAVRASGSALSAVHFSEACAALANLNGDFRSTVLFFAFATAKRDEIKVSRVKPLQKQCDRILDAARTALTGEQFEEATARGGALSSEAMLDAAAKLDIQSA